ncbi:DUF5703 family protein [Aquipuribacter sp. SD81]|uniref:DUF5703 family protein n=1 Tax=Aquipuribacter sp. SD81 TaxID=3127703 RepID=UPI0030182B8A
MSTLARTPAQFEYRVLVVGRGADRGRLRQQLADEAEYGKWELARTRVYVGGARKVWLRRKVMRVAKTL